jgi:hypothetical protein
LSRTIEVHCPCGCDHWFKVQIDRQNRKGEGAYYSSRMTKLSPQHQLILDVFSFFNVSDELVGWPWHRVYRECAETAKMREMRIPTSKGLSGRLSELVGAKLVECTTPNEIELRDAETMQFRHRNRKEQVYWLKREERPMQVKLSHSDQLADLFIGG